MRPLWGLDFWKSGEWQVIQERLSDLGKAKVPYHPHKKDMLKSLHVINPEDVKVVILGQDPYPSRKYSTGVAFSIPENEDTFPPTLTTIFNEYEEDLGYPFPETGDLTPWIKQGVLLFNVLPTITTGKSLSHDWDEYRYLTWAVLDRLSDQSCVVVCVGGFAATFLRPKDYDTFEVITVSHPSPRAIKISKNPFKGSRLFSTINGKLCEIGLTPIDWRLK